jgi:hypothetical protein
MSLIDVNGNIEIVRVTARATDSFTIVRAQEGTAARSFSAGDRVELRLTAGAIADVQTELNTAITTGDGTKVDKNQSITISTLTVNTAKILGRTTAGSGAIEELNFDAVGFAAGTAMLFQQTAAPTGWTKSVTHNNKALRLVNGTVSTGGTAAFTTAFASRTPAGSVAVSGGSVSAASLSTAQLASHTHAYTSYDFYGGNMTGSVSGASGSPVGTTTSTSAGSGSTHTHGFTAPTASFTGTAMDFAVQYVDVIIATKN